MSPEEVLMEQGRRFVKEWEEVLVLAIMFMEGEWEVAGIQEDLYNNQGNIKVETHMGTVKTGRQVLDYPNTGAVLSSLCPALRHLALAIVTVGIIYISYSTLLSLPRCSTPPTQGRCSPASGLLS